MGKQESDQRRGGVIDMENKEVLCMHRPQVNQNQKPAALKMLASQVGVNVRVQAC